LDIVLLLSFDNNIAFLEVSQVTRRLLDLFSNDLVSLNKGESDDSSGVETLGKENLGSSLTIERRSELEGNICFILMYNQLSILSVKRDLYILQQGE
jgi:hypothetical protein